MIEQIIEKIEQVAEEYKNDKDLTPGERVWARCALAEVRAFVETFKS